MTLFTVLRTLVDRPCFLCPTKSMKNPVECDTLHAFSHGLVKTVSAYCYRDFCHRTFTIFYLRACTYMCVCILFLIAKLFNFLQQFRVIFFSVCLISGTKRENRLSRVCKIMRESLVILHATYKVSRGIFNTTTSALESCHPSAKGCDPDLPCIAIRSPAFVCDRSSAFT